MVNVTGNRAKQRIALDLNRAMIVFESRMANDVFKVFRKQFKRVASLIEDFSRDYEAGIKEYTGELTDVFVDNYKRVSKHFGDKALNEAGFTQTKTIFDEYLAELDGFINTYVGLRIKKINDTTLNIVKRLVRIATEDGKTNAEIAKVIRGQVTGIGSLSAKVRSKTIARTETHSAANNSMQAAMKTSRIIKSKEWISVQDSRTRSKNFNHFRANGETVNIDGYFTRTGESLKYPGDFYGSPGNIINCRCQLIYGTNREGV